jgi:hypothetical protein
MSLDTTALGVAAAKLMDEIADEYPEDAQIEAAAVVVDLSFRGEDGEERTSVQWRFVNGEGNTLSSAHAGGIARIMDACLKPQEGEAEE